MHPHAANLRPLASFKPFALALPLALALACVSETAATPLPGNLLVGAKPDNAGIPEAERMIDGLLPVEGDPWDTGITARFGNPEAQITWDLGAKKTIAAALLQGDNNDVYVLSASDDGKTFRPLWQAQPESGAGMRLRQTTLKDSARYIRLSATGGDSLFSVGEVAVFSELPSGWPGMKLTRAEGTTADKVADASASWGISLGVFGAAVVILVLLSRRSRPVVSPPAPETEPEAPTSPPAPPAA